MTTLRLVALTLAAATLLPACAWNPQQAHIDPPLSVVPSDAGRGVSLAFRVIDERTSKQIGNRGNGYGKAAQITSNADLSEVVERKVRAGLEARGFKVVAFEQDASPRLTLEIRALDYQTSNGAWTGGVEVKSALKVVAMRDGRLYEKMYRSEAEQRVAMSPAASKNEAWLNASLSDVLTQVFDDAGLFHHVTARQ